MTEEIKGQIKQFSEAARKCEGEKKWQEAADNWEKVEKLSTDIKWTAAINQAQRKRAECLKNLPAKEQAAEEINPEDSTQKPYVPTGKINAEFDVLFHPEMKLQPKEVAVLYSSNGGKNFEDVYANRITEKNWNVQLFDLDDRVPLEFFVRIVFKDGRLMLGKKDGQNYKIQLRDNTGAGKYKAQVRMENGNLVLAGRRCLVCDQIIPAGKNICQSEECHAVFCPYCQRMLPPFANFCPWDKKSFPIR